MKNKQIKYFFCGLGGSGMSAIAQVLRSKGVAVAGSDRSFDQGKSLEKFACLESQGIKLFPQDGSGVDSSVDILVVSSAIEESIPDVAAAKKLGVKIKKRSEILAEIFNASQQKIAVGGTSGKSTVTGMIAHILTVLKQDPTVINGAVMLNALSQNHSSIPAPTTSLRNIKCSGNLSKKNKNVILNETEKSFDLENYSLGNMYCGTGKSCVIEADESDGSIAFYTPDISVLNNITLDHKPLEELRPLFQDFIEKANLGAVLNLDCEETQMLFSDVLNSKKIRSYSIKNKSDFQAKNISPRIDGIDFFVQDIKVSLQVAGRYNILNALAAITAVSFLGISLKKSAEALKTFTGIERRMQTIGTKNGVTVIDDFAHNPDKIAASLAALKEHDGRLWVIFQPHGFAPTKLLKDGLVTSFTNHLDANDCLIMPEIYYAGGTTKKDISSRDILSAVELAGKKVNFFETRNEILPFIISQVKNGDRIIIMGARDDTLTDFAKNILNSLV